MKTIFIFLFSAFLLVSCSNDDDKAVPNSNFNPVTITPTLVAKGNMFGTSLTNPISAQKTVIINNADWNNFLNYFDAYQQTTMFTSTTVDFNQDEVIALIDETRSDNGYRIGISNITENANNIVVTVNLSYEGGALTAFTRPIHIVKIPKSSKPVVFQ